VAEVQERLRMARDAARHATAAARRARRNAFR
jgi:hypothetical protein